MSAARTAGSRLSRPERVVIGVMAGTFVLLISLVIVVAVTWSGAQEPPAAVTQSWDDYRPAWESAMAKAGVEATFPAEPVRFGELVVSGFISLDTTLTGDEVTALATMYPFAYSTPEGTVALLQPQVSFPTDGRVRVTGWLAYQGSSYQFDGAVDAEIADGRLVYESGTAEMQVAGFTVDGERRDQALRAIEEYVNALLTAAPRLTVLDADVVEGAVRVEGAAPQRIVHPTGE